MNTISNRNLSSLAMRLCNEQHGIAPSAELILLGTILILGVIVGLGELHFAVVGEISDLANAAGNLDQSHRIPGITGFKSDGIKAQSFGTDNRDQMDEGDCSLIVICDQITGQGEKKHPPPPVTR